MMNEASVRETVYNRPFIRQRADPYILRWEGGCYFTASVPAYDRIVLRYAPTLSGLREAPERTLWVKHESGPQSIHIWAPELHRIDGAWYIYYAAGDKDDVWEIRPYVLHCTGDDPMADPWEELGPMQPAPDDPFSFRAFSLDATVFENRGQRYMVWAEKVGVGKQISNLYIARMATPTRLATVQVLLTTPDYDWERGEFWVNEAPAVLRHDGKLFLTFSANTTGEQYCMGMLWAREDADLLDPFNWTKLRRPVFCSDAEKEVHGPGHNCFVKADDGETDLCVYHARQYGELEGNPLYDPNRHAYVMPVTYDADGFPEFRHVPQEW